MFRAHSAACAAVSRAPPRLVDALLAGELHDEPALRRHVYCVLLKCKLVSKDGKLQKAAVLGKMAARPDAKNATKVRLRRGPIPGQMSAGVAGTVQTSCRGLATWAI